MLDDVIVTGLRGCGLKFYRVTAMRFGFLPDGGDAVGFGGFDAALMMSL